METKNKKNGVADQGSETKKFTQSEFRKMVEYDIKTATHLLNALSQDKDALDHLADFLHGRYLNRVHKNELEAQLEIKS